MTSYYFKSVFFLTLFASLLSLGAFGQQIWTSQTTGAWTAAGTWTVSGGASGAAPTTMDGTGANRDVVIIENGHTVTLSGTSLLLKDAATITVQSGGKLILTGVGYKQESSNNVFTIINGSVEIGQNMDITAGTVNWQNASIFVTQNYNFVSGTNATIINTCQRAGQNIQFSGTGNSTTRAIITGSYLLAGVSSTGNVKFESSCFITFDKTILRTIAGGGNVDFLNSNFQGNITAVGATSNFNTNTMAGTTTLDYYCVGSTLSGIAYFGGSKINNCSVVNGFVCGVGTTTETYTVSGTVKNGTLATGTGQGVYGGTQMYVSLVNGLGSIVATATVAANGTYSFVGIFPDDYHTILHTTSTGSTTPAQPNGFAFNGEDPNGTTANDGKSSFAVTNANVTSNFALIGAQTTLPDMNAAYINTTVSGDVSTNDQVVGGTTYGNPQADVSNPVGATLNLNTDGTYTFTAPLPGKYFYLINVCAPWQTPVSSCPIELLTITVLSPDSLNNPPVANPDFAVTLQGDAVTLNTLANDAAGSAGLSLNPASVQVLTTIPTSEGTTAVNTTTGEITFTPAASFTGTIIYTYQVCYVSAPTLCAISTQEITVLPTGTTVAVVGTDDYNQTLKGQTVTSNAAEGVLANDMSTANPSSLTASLVGPAAQVGVGTLTLNANGSYTFVPDTNFVGTAVYVYEVCQGTVCAQATLYILVGNQTTSPDADTTFVNTPLAGDVSTNDQVIAGTVYGTATPDANNPTGATLTMNLNGTYTFIATNTGVYIYDVEVCGPGQTPNLNPSACGSEKLTLTVLAARTITITATPECVNDVPWMNYTITSNFDMTGLTGDIIWFTGPGEVGIPNPNNVALVPTVAQSTPILSGTFYSGRTLWPGAQVDNINLPTPNPTLWPAWKEVPLGSGNWIYEEDGFSGYRTTPSFAISVNPSDTISSGINYPPSSPFCTTQPRVGSFTGTVWHDIDGSGTATWTNIKTNTETGTNVSNSLYVYALGISPATGLLTVLDRAVVAADGTYEFTDLIQCDNITIVLTTNENFFKGDDNVNQNIGAGLPTEQLPSGWASTSPAARSGITTFDGNVSNADLGIQQIPTSGVAGNNGTINNNTLINPIYNPGVIGREQIPAAAFGGTDPDGSITSILITALGTDVHSITIGGATGTTYYKNAGDIPAVCPTNACVVFPAAGVEVATNTSGQPTSSIEITPVATFIDGNLSLNYKVIDNANVATGTGAESDNTTTLTIPVIALKYDLTNGNGGWYNGGGSIGGPGNSFKPNTIDDADHTLFWISTPGIPADILDVDAVVANLIVFSGAEGVVSGCLTVNDGVKIDGTIRFKAITETQYGQFLGPEMPNTIFEMILNETGWHNISFPVHGQGSTLTAGVFAAQNNTTASPEVVNLSNDPTTHNLWWYDSKTSGGKEQGFFINRGDNTLAGGLAGTNNYSTHAYGTWHMVQPTEVLNTRGYNYFIDGFFVPSMPHVIQAIGITNEANFSVSTHNNFGGWNLIPNPYPVTIDPKAMYDDGFFGSEFDNAIWIWDPGDAFVSPLPGQFTTGAYVAVNAATGAAVNGGNANTIGTSANLVAPFQSFYIRRTSASDVRRKDGSVADTYAPNDAVAAGAINDPAVSGSDLNVILKKEYRTNCNITKHYKDDWDIIMVRAMDKANGTYDETDIAFDNAYTERYEKGSDIMKINTVKNGPTIFSIADNKGLVSNMMNYPIEVTTVPLAFYSEFNNRNYELELAKLPDGWRVYLEDKSNGAWHDMLDGPYSFKNRTDFRLERFVLHFSMKSDPIKQVKPAVYVWDSHVGLEVSFTNMLSPEADVRVSNLLGQILYHKAKVSTSENHSIDLWKKEPQVYLVTITTAELTQTIKIVR